MTEPVASRLDKVATLASGGTPSKANPEYWNGSTPWLTPKDMAEFDGSTQESVTANAIGNGTRLAPPGTIFIAVRGMSLHKEIRIARTDRPMTFNQDIKAIIPKDIDGRYLYYALLSKKPLLLGSVESAGHGTGVLPTDKLSATAIPERSLKKQKAIASVLGALDDKITLNRHMNDTLGAAVQAVFKDWFVDFGPSRTKMNGEEAYLAPNIWSLFPDCLDKDGKPEQWKCEAVFEQAMWVNGAAYKDMYFSSEADALPVVKIAELKNGITKTTRFTNTNLGERYKISDGELLFSWSGNPDTSIDTFVWTFGDAWLNQHIFAVRSNGRRSQPFLYAMLKLLRPKFAEIARNKQTTGLGHVTQQDLIRLKIAVPDEDTHAAFNELVEPLYARLVANLFENQSLGSTRDFLLPRLISGEVRVGDAEQIVGVAT